MNKKIRQLLFRITLCVILSSTLSGCWSSRELNNLSIAVGIGIDKAEVPDDVLLTAQIVNPAEIKKGKNSPGGESTAYWNLHAASRTIFDAFRKSLHEISNRLYLSHTQVIIFGKAAAAEGVRKYLDFFLRSHETRPTILILVSDHTATEVLDVKPHMEKLPAIKLAKLVKSQDFTGQAMEVTLQDFTTRLLSKTASPVAPLVTLTGEGKNKLLHVENMAVFKKDKLVGALNSTETRGLLWVIGKVKSGVIAVDFSDGKTTLEITKAQSNILPEINNGKVHITIKVKVAATVAVQTSPDNVATVPAIALLEERQREIIRSEILSALKKARELNTDIFAFGEIVHEKYGTEWKQIEENWDAIFPDLDVQIEIDSKIMATGLIAKPAISEKKE
jgi:spore germination protein KC